MTSRNFTVTVKESEADQPCFLVLKLSEDIGLGNQSIILDLPEDSTIVDAAILAKTLNIEVANIRLLK